MDERDAKLKNMRRRIDSLDAAIVKGQEYLAHGEHANWPGFRPYFYGKLKDGKELAPHRDWVRNVFIPSTTRELNRAARILERV